MTSKEFKPEGVKVPKKRGRPPGKPKTENSTLANKGKSPEEIARAKYEARKERQSKNGALEGEILWVPADDLKKLGYDYRWILDDGRRLDEVESLGYFKASKKSHPILDGVYSNGTDGEISIGTSDKNGKPTRQYLMLRPLDISAERESQKIERLRKRDAGLVASDHSQGLGRERTSDGRSAAYVPQGSSVFKPEG